MFLFSFYTFSSFDPPLSFFSPIYSPIFSGKTFLVCVGTCSKIPSYSDFNGPARENFTVSFRSLLRSLLPRELFLLFNTDQIIPLRILDIQ